MIGSKLTSWRNSLTAGLFWSSFSLMKTGLIAGSACSFFSTAPLALPIAGFFGGIPALAVALCLRIALTQSLHMGLLNFQAYHIPTICAALYAHFIWNSSFRPNITVRACFALIPLICMATFVANPQGGVAWPYTLFWIIPAASALIPHRNFAFHALATTFTAHAVGSAFWIWAHLSTPALWIGLIPVVIYERCLSGLILWGIVTVGSAALRAMKNKREDHVVVAPQGV